MNAEEFSKMIRTKDLEELRLFYHILCNQMSFKKLEEKEEVRPPGRPPGPVGKYKRRKLEYTHTCKKCGKSWTGLKKNPLVCGHCGAYDWK